MMIGPELIIIIALVLIVAVFFLKGIMQPAKRMEVKVGNATVNAEVADTLPKQIKGLMFRSSLPQNEGMLFDFGEEGYHEIWMMNMSFPIDIVWINNGKVVDIRGDAQPCKIFCPSYGPKEPARYVLEVNANFTNKHGIKIGTKVELR